MIKRIEFQQTSLGGGFPCPTQEDGFEHGEAVYIVSKKDLNELLRFAKDIYRDHPQLQTQEIWRLFRGKV